MICAHDVKDRKKVTIQGSERVSKNYRTNVG
jgi:hypothetical protein